ncbi:MAG: tetratricopeptide repeat protein [Saprospiraceae bacterium]|nr:tetratricopeptide repeat protein [Saprospiraceae bacterium]
MKASLILILSFFSSILSGQINEDSLLNIINTSSNDSIVYNSHIQLIAYNKFRNLEKVKEHCDKIFELSKRYKENKLTGNANYYYGFYYRIKGDNDRSKTHLYKSAEYGEEFDDFRIHGASLNELAIILESEGNQDEAIKLYLQIIELYENNDYHRGAITQFNNIGLLYQNMGDAENAVNYYRKTKRLARLHEDHYNEELAAGNISAGYINQSMFDSAAIYAKECLEISERFNYTRSVVYANTLLAHIFLSKKEYKDALKYAKNSFEINKKYSEKSMNINSYVLFGDIYSGLGDYDNMILNHNEALKISKELNYLAGQQLSHKALYNAYKSRGNYKKALEHFDSCQTLSDTLSKKENIKIVNDLNIKYETAKKDAEITSQQIEIIEKTSQRNLYLSGLLVVGLISIFVLNRYKLKQKLAEEEIQNLEHEQKLIAIDYMVQGQQEERKRIASDLHDGLGGLLASASMQLQKIQTEINNLTNLKLTDKVEELIDSAYSEVRRIAHDMMPSALIDLGLKAAIEDVADQFNLGESVRVTTQIFVPEIELTEKKQVVIYRIVQEALNNIKKHAKAKNAIIQLSRNNGSFHLSIEDDGIGFDKNDKALENGMGLKSIKSRVKYLNGSLDIQSEPGQGTSIEILIPV